MPYPPRATGDNPYGPQVKFRTEDVLPPTALYLSMDDTLVVQCICPASPMTGTATVRMLLPDGTLRVDYYDILPSTINPFYSFAVIPPVEGYILSAIIQLHSTVDGSCWCQMTAFKGSVQQPIVSLPPVSGLLVVQGYVDNWTFLAWPNSPAVEAGMGAGRVRNIALAPAAGSNWTCRTTTAQRWEVLAVQARLQTSAAAPTRLMSLDLVDRLGNLMVRYPCNFTQAATLPCFYFFYNGAAHLNVVTGSAPWVTAPLPTGQFLDPGMSLQSLVVNLDVGDTWSFVNITVTEWMGVGHS